MPSGVTEKLQVIRLIYCLADGSDVNSRGIYGDKVRNILFFFSVISSLCQKWSEINA